MAAAADEGRPAWPAPAAATARCRGPLGDTGDPPWSIESVRGVGYRYRLPTD